MKRQTAVAGVIVVGILVAVLMVAPVTAINGPENDLCENAIPVTVGSTTSGSTNGASIDTGYPGPCGAASVITAPGVWYTVVGTGNQIEASTCHLDTGYRDYDSQISVYCPTCADPVCVDGNDDACEDPYPFLSTVTWCSQTDTKYYILVHGYFDSTGDFDLSVSDVGPCTEPPVPCEVSVGGATFLWDWWPF
jgi:hypothetical protein